VWEKWKWGKKKADWAGAVDLILMDIHKSLIIKSEVFNSALLEI
jgi:hypothetical protein